MTSCPPIFSEADGLGHEPDEMVLCGPPGCGKTRAVLEHFLLPAVDRWPTQAILGCSFTRAAAEEMRARLAARSPGTDERVLKSVCSTIHSEAFRLCRAAGYKSIWKAERTAPGPVRKGGEEAEGEPVFVGWEALEGQRDSRREEAERLWSLARHLRPEDLLPPGEAYTQRQVTALLSRALGRQPQRLRFTFDELVSETLVYEADKRKNKDIDFCDMLGYALSLGYPERELIVVDEAQDLSPLQIALVRRWAQGSRRLAWIGDADQGIFRFSGADGSHLTELMRNPAIRTRRLAQSWRVPKAAHAEARALILRNRNRVDAPYEPAERPGSISEAWTPERALREALSEPGTIFVLGRTGRALDPYAQALIEDGEPFARERGGSSPLRQKTLIAVLSAIHDLLDRLAITTDAALALADSLKARPKGRFEGTKKAARAAIKDLGEREEYLSRRDMERCGVVLGPVLAPGTLEGSLGVLGMKEECEPLLRIYRKHGIDALTEEPRITLTTMHTSKGREAKTVVVDLLAPAPSRWCVDSGDAAAIEDERKVLYVGLTRTEDNLILRRADRQEDLLCLLG